MSAPWDSTRTLTPLDCLEYGRLEGFWKPRVHRAGFLLFTLKGLEVVQATLASDLALELFEPVERHACSVGPGDRSGVR